MSLRLTVDVFSGRPNPAVDLDERESNRLLERLAPARLLEPGEPDLPPEPLLGYRGVLVEQVGEQREDLPQSFRVADGDLFGRGLAHKARDEDVERLLLDPEGPLRRLELDRDFFEQLHPLVEELRAVRVKFPLEIVWPWWIPVCPCGPLYEPAWWNVPERQWSNNCYNYATNYRTNTFAQPGKAAGAMYTSLTCDAVKAGALADELIDAPKANNTCPTEGHLVALVVAPFWDFHWYRKGRNGRWSHKPGSTPVTEFDNSGKVIVDPRNADRGPYKDFCTFMIVMHGHVRIS